MGEVNCPGPPHFLSLMLHRALTHREGLPTRLGAGSGDLPSPPIPPNPERAATSHKAFPVPKEQDGSRRKGRACSDKGGQELHRKDLGQLMPAEHPLEGLGSPQGCTEQLSCPQEVPEFGCCTTEGFSFRSPQCSLLPKAGLSSTSRQCSGGGNFQGQTAPPVPQDCPTLLGRELFLFITCTHAQKAPRGHLAPLKEEIDSITPVIALSQGTGSFLTPLSKSSPPQVRSLAISAASTTSSSISPHPSPPGAIPHVAIPTLSRGTMPSLHLLTTFLRQAPAWGLFWDCWLLLNPVPPAAPSQQGSCSKPGTQGRFTLLGDNCEKRGRQILPNIQQKSISFTLFKSLKVHLKKSAYYQLQTSVNTQDIQRSPKPQEHRSHCHSPPPPHLCNPKDSVEGGTGHALNLVGQRAYSC